MVTLNNLCLPIVGVALMVSAAAVCGCSEKKPVYTEADVAAAGKVAVSAGRVFGIIRANAGWCR